MSPLDQLPNVSHSHQTTDWVKSEMRVLKDVLAVLDFNYIDRKDWSFTLNKGSFSCVKKSDPRLRILLFVDHENKLSCRFYPALHPNPFAVAVCLKGFDPLVRDAVRERLATLTPYYMDPRDPAFSLWTFLPQAGNIVARYDVLFLREAPCDLPFDPEFAERLSTQLAENFDRAHSIGFVEWDLGQ